MSLQFAAFNFDLPCIERHVSAVVGHRLHPVAAEDIAQEFPHGSIDCLPWRPIDEYAGKACQRVAAEKDILPRGRVGLALRTSFGDEGNGFNVWSGV